MQGGGGGGDDRTVLEITGQYFADWESGWIWLCFRYRIISIAIFCMITIILMVILCCIFGSILPSEKVGGSGSGFVLDTQLCS